MEWVISTSQDMLRQELIQALDVRSGLHFNTSHAHSADIMGLSVVRSTTSTKPIWVVGNGVEVGEGSASAGSSAMVVEVSHQCLLIMPHCTFAT